MALPYQIIGAAIGLIAIFLGLLRFREGKMSMGMFLFWIFLWIGVIYISIFPGSAIILTNITGIARGLDLLMILGLFLAFYLIFRIYTMVENMEKEITTLVRELALQRENIKIKKDEIKTDSETK